MPAAPIGSTEDDLIDTLTAAVGDAKLRVDSLPGDWDDDMHRRLLRLAPCLLVAFTGAVPMGNGTGHVPELLGQWAVYVVTAHPSGEGARRRGNAQGLGAYEIIERLVVPVLHNHVVADVGTLTLDRVDNLYTGTVDRQGLAVYAVTFRLPMAFDLAGSDDLANFATFAARYDIPPHASGVVHQQWLGGNESNGKPDASDTVLLPTA